MRHSNGLSLSLLLTLAVVAPACADTPADQFRDFGTGTGGGGASDTGGLDMHICVSDFDGVTADRVFDPDCPVDTSHACWASEYHDQTPGAACCLIGSESDCYMAWGEPCPGSHVHVCDVEPLGNGDGDGDGDGDPALLACIDGTFVHLATGCEAGTQVGCEAGAILPVGTQRVCCAPGDTVNCGLMAYTESCPVTKTWHVCDIQ